MISINQFSQNRQATVTREGNTLTVTDSAHQNCRCPGDFYYSVGLAEDSITLSGSDRERGRFDYQIALSPNSVEVKDTNDTRRNYFMNVSSETPLNSEQQRSFGLNVVSSLIGLPLIAVDGSEAGAAASEKPSQSYETR